MASHSSAERRATWWIWILMATLGVVAAYFVGTALNNNDDETASSPASTSSPTPSPTPTPSAMTPSPSPEPTAVATDPTRAPEDASVTITTAYWDESQNGFVVTAFADLLVPTATCTATATKDTSQVQATSQASPNATNTDCGTILFPDGTLSTGRWSIVVSFESADYSGVSGEIVGLVP